MSITQTSEQHATEITRTEPIDLKLEVVAIPVSDVDRAKRFYGSLGWSVDADFVIGEDFRVVQMTPPGSPCSIHFGKGITKAVPGSAQGLFLVVSDIETARRDLAGHGVNVSDVFHFEGEHRVAPGPDPQGRSYFSYASFNDPDGNGWLLQEIKTRLPGRGLSSDIATLTELLREAEKLHGEYGPKAQQHHWSDWYAGYIVARERGKTSDAAASDATRRIGAASDRAHA